MYHCYHRSPSTHVPPMSHTLSLNPSCMSDLMLNPCVGMMWLMSSSDNCNTGNETELEEMEEMEKMKEI